MSGLLIPSKDLTLYRGEAKFPKENRKKFLAGNKKLLKSIIKKPKPCGQVELTHVRKRNTSEHKNKTRTILLVTKESKTKK